MNEVICRLKAKLSEYAEGNREIGYDDGEEKDLLWIMLVGRLLNWLNKITTNNNVELLKTENAYERPEVRMTVVQTQEIQITNQKQV